ncbi:PIN domain-containing protein [Halalkalicoccus salilacus]|uniref:PIN domain-containing protein n=1 Tax=Halalkalicoccus TaxID=332246 RepID=UPI002F96C0BC
MVAVCMDTNALMMPIESGVRVFEELERLLPEGEPVAPDAVVRELRGLAEGAGEEAVAASVGLDLVRERCRIVESPRSHADDAIVSLASAGEFEYVVTNDGPLRERLLGAGVPVIGLRGRNKLEVTQP